MHSILDIWNMSSIMKVMGKYTQARQLQTCSHDCEEFQASEKASCPVITRWTNVKHNAEISYAIYLYTNN